MALCLLVAGVQGPWPDRLTAYLLPPVGSVVALALAMAAVVALVFVLVARRTAVVSPGR